jgi:hypothetical protein
MDVQLDALLLLPQTARMLTFMKDVHNRQNSQRYQVQLEEQKDLWKQWIVHQKLVDAMTA